MRTVLLELRAQLRETEYEMERILENLTTSQRNLDLKREQKEELEKAIKLLEKGEVENG